MDQLMTVIEAAARCRCRPETIRRYIASGQLPALQFPKGYYRIREGDLMMFLRPVHGRRRDETASNVTCHTCHVTCHTSGTNGA